MSFYSADNHASFFIAYWVFFILFWSSQVRCFPKYKICDYTFLLSLHQIQFQGTRLVKGERCRQSENRVQETTFRKHCFSYICVTETLTAQPGSLKHKRKRTEDSITWSCKCHLVCVSVPECGYFKWRSWDWRDSSYYSCRLPVPSTHMAWNSSPSSLPPSGLCRHCTYVLVHTPRQNTHTNAVVVIDKNSILSVLVISKILFS